MLVVQAHEASFLKDGRMQTSGFNKGLRAKPAPWTSKLLQGER
jgi:hypothetical protein